MTISRLAITLIKSYFEKQPGVELTTSNQVNRFSVEMIKGNNIEFSIFYLNDIYYFFKLITF